MNTTSRARRIAFFALSSFATILMLTSQAHAFCGFFVSEAGTPLYNDATQVVLMRYETQTVLSMRNNYKGPPEDFAMVVPVPQVLQEEDVKTLPDDLFDRLEKYSAPRLVEYWQKDPCAYARETTSFGRVGGLGSAGVKTVKKSEGSRYAVEVEVEFEVDEYNVAVLSATESSGLERWLLDNKYNIPKGASKVLAPYIAQGMYFFVAKVNADKVRFDSKGNALLSPLRFHYESEDFSLPVRLGLLNANGAQDLLIHILAQNQRYETANYPNLTIPTNLIVPGSTRKSFSAFYNGLFDYTTERHPGAVVTEYSWNLGSPWSGRKCDPCTVMAPMVEDLHLLGLNTLVARTREVETLEVDVDYVTVSPASDNALTSEMKSFANSARRRLQHCYTKYIRKAPARRSGRMAVEFSSAENGLLFDFSYPWDSFKDDAFKTCVQRALRAKAFRPAPPHDNPFELVSARFEIALAFSYKVREIIRRPPPSDWTITRLHARYTEETMTEDLVFQTAPSIRGGMGTLDPKGEVLEEGVEASKVNRFQARYIIAHRFTGKLTCKKSEMYWDWGGRPSSGTRKPLLSAPPAASTKRESAPLSKKMKKAAQTYLEREVERLK